MANKSNLRMCLAISMLYLVVAGLAQAATITVGPGAGYNFDTIQAGIDAANDADTVLVAPGEYVITEPVTFRGKAITVRSEAGPDETTIRMGTPADTNRGSVVVFENNETDASVLDGFTITGGTGCRLWRAEAHGAPEFNWDGGGILFNASSGTVQNCAIVQNRVEDAGGGVMVILGSSAILTNCIISENSAPNSDESGGGVSCAYNSSVTMTECIIRDNSTRAVGGGVSCWYGSVTMTCCTIMSNTTIKCGAGVYVGHGSATLTNCVIARNTAGSDWGGGGVICSYSDAYLTISNCTICGNSAGDWDWGGGGVLCRQASATVTNSIIWGNTAPKGREISVQDAASTLTITYSSVLGGQSGVSVEGSSILNWGVGNIDADPYFANPNRDDFHLKSEAGRWDPNSQSWIQDDVTSPCIDQGDPSSDWRWRPELWPHGIRTNMGAYGGTLQSSRSLSDAGNVVDLNRDGIVDSADVCMMVDHWHTYEPYCDIAPAPFGDSIVDVQDLVVLAENLFEDYRLDLAMIAHWKMDETIGNSAYDSISNNNGTLHGDPVWQPVDGKIDGALQLDGIDDYISTPFILDPAKGSLSVFAWIKGGAPGQVIISQTGGFGGTWLGTNSSEGKLMTGLSGAYFGALESESVITDGQWHHVGLVYDLDALHRHLYVDGIEVAVDSDYVAGVPSNGGLYIGAAKDLDVATFFSGLIDDVRIYNRAVTP